MSDDFTRDAHAAVRFGFWAIFSTIIVGLILGTVLFLRPVWLGFKHRQNVASHQYVEARRSALNDLVSDYDELATQLATRQFTEEQRRSITTQMEGLRHRMRNEADRIPEDDVPSPVWRILSQGVNR